MSDYYVRKPFVQRGRQYRRGDRWQPQGTRKDIIILREHVQTHRPRWWEW